MTPERLTLPQAAKSFPLSAEGRTIHAETVRRWACNGVRVKSGRRVRLKTEQVGGRMFTRPEWIEAFNVELNGGTEPVVFLSKQTGGMSADLRDVIAKGVHGAKAKKQLLGL